MEKNVERAGNLVRKTMEHTASFCRPTIQEKTDLTRQEFLFQTKLWICL